VDSVFIRQALWIVTLAFFFIISTMRITNSCPFATWTSLRRWAGWAGWEPLGEGIHNFFLQTKSCYSSALRVGNNMERIWSVGIKSWGEELKKNSLLSFDGQLIFFFFLWWLTADPLLNAVAERKLLHKPLPLSRNVLQEICAVRAILRRRLMVVKKR
jgi:hypothetical protein